ncbi:MAG: amino acid ABC transporter permease [Thermodesulfobacteriota bacterium]
MSGPTITPVLLKPAPTAGPNPDWGNDRGFSGFVSDARLGLVLALALGLSLTAGEVLAAVSQEPGVLATVWKWLPLMTKGFLLNLLVSVLSMSIGTAAGLALGLVQMSHFKPVGKTAGLLTQFFRNAPWLVLVFYTITLIPFELQVGGYIVPFPAWIKATVGLSLPVMANVSEIVRGGIQSIPLSQWESAEALAFSRFQTMWFIILPQCLKRMLPPWMNLYAILTTASPLISLVGVDDALTMTRAALQAEQRIDLLLPMYLALLIMFFVYCYPIAVWTVRLERRYAVKA